MSKFVLMAGWSDVPHIDKSAQEALIGSYSLHERDARSRGIPQLGSGAIYPVPEEDLVVNSFEIPAWYKLAYGLDIGWNRTAALWGAVNPETDVLYLFHEYYRSAAEVPVHAKAIKAPGQWIPGVIDPSAAGAGKQRDGEGIMAMYQAEGLSLSPADNRVEAGLYEVWTRMSSGRLKVFSNLQNFLTEFHIYRRDEKGKVVKSMDHLMDCMRYLVMSGLSRARAKPYESWPQARAKRHTYEYDPMAEAYAATPQTGARH